MTKTSNTIGEQDPEFTRFLQSLKTWSETYTPENDESPTTMFEVFRKRDASYYKFLGIYP